jgi:hypothetical protein
MNIQDHHGNPLSPASDAALAAYASALHQFHCYQGDPLATLAAATEAEPGFAMGHLMQAWLLLLSTEPSALPDALALLARAEPLAGTWREQAHLHAAQAFAAGRWRQAARVLEDLGVAHPRDALALQAGHLADFLLGDARMLRDRIARALPAWGANERGVHALLAMHAFGLEECGALAEAERQGRRALALEPADAWAHHAVVHVMETQGRSAEGQAFVRERSAHWACGFFAVHNWWHLALFQLDQGDVDGALALFDGPVWGERSALVVDLVDAAALLWRVQLHPATTAAQRRALAGRFDAVATAWTEALGDSGVGQYAFNDWHAGLAATAAGRRGLAQALREAVPAPGSDNAAMAAEVGQPLLDALHAIAEGRPRAALPLLRDARARSARFGGSHAQRELVDLMLLNAAEQAGELPLARALLAERLASKPASALNQGLAGRLARAAGAAPFTADGMGPAASADGAHQQLVPGDRCAGVRGTPAAQAAACSSTGASA